MRYGKELRDFSFEHAQYYVEEHLNTDTATLESECLRSRTARDVRTANPQYNTIRSDQDITGLCNYSNKINM